jgi:hypothetical protein
VDVSPTDQIADVKTRLLSDAARQIRLARLDNVKSLKFSWADLEGLITSTEISGRRLYSGEGRRPNTIVWGITLNGATLSKDLAQRVIPIQLARPSYSAEWERDSREFVRANRWEILADIGEILTGPRRAITVRSRWATWEEEVLSRCIGVADCQGLIAARQDAVDEDAGEQDTLREFFADQLSLHGFSASMQKIFIPNSVASIWVNRASNQKLSTNRATSYLASLGVRELRKSALTGRKGWTWTGENASTIATAIPLPSHLVEEIVGGHRP